VSSRYLFKNYDGKLPVLNDLLLQNTPYLKIGWFYDFIIVVSILAFCIYALKKDVKEIPYFLLMFGIINIIRGIFIVITPFANPINEYNGFLQSEMYRLGVYPSGHTGAGFLAFLLAKDKVFKIILFVASLLIIISLLLGRGHYSIDIFSAVIFAYATYAFGEKYIKKRFCGLQTLG